MLAAVEPAAVEPAAVGPVAVEPVAAELAAAALVAAVVVVAAAAVAAAADLEHVKRVSRISLPLSQNRTCFEASLVFVFDCQFVSTVIFFSKYYILI